MSKPQSDFWEDLADDLRDPDFLREYVRQSVRIATIDRIVNDLDDAREAAGLAKADLARAASAEPATIRRLFSSSHVNPTVGTLAELAAVLGLRLTLEPLPTDEREQLTRSLREGHNPDTRALAKRLESMRQKRSTPA